MYLGTQSHVKIVERFKRFRYLFFKWSRVRTSDMFRQRARLYEMSRMVSVLVLPILNGCQTVLVFGVIWWRCGNFGHLLLVSC